MAAVFKHIAFLLVVSFACLPVSATDRVPLTGDHVCVGKLCQTVEHNDSYTGCEGCPHELEPPTVAIPPKECFPWPNYRNYFINPTPSSPACPTSRKETCYHLVMHTEARSTNVKQCCNGYVEREDGKCVEHHAIDHWMCQIGGDGFATRCGRNAACVDDHCVCHRGYALDGRDCVGTYVVSSWPYVGCGLSGYVRFCPLLTRQESSSVCCCPLPAEEKVEPDMMITKLSVVNGTFNTHWRSYRSKRSSEYWTKLPYTKTEDM